jgi:rare lipoprotein A (peptidoglycan hydrolase)
MNCKRLNFFLFFFLSFLSSAQNNSGVKRSSNASYYNNYLHGLETSNGETYDKNDFTAAHRSLPFNTLLLVTNKKNNRTVVVRVNDRGPFKKSRVLDLSYAAAKKIGMVPFGVVPVKIDVLKFLDQTPIPEPLVQEEKIWNCYGKKQGLTNHTVFIWQTDNWKHAFYMASNLNMEYKIPSLVVKVSGQSKNKRYSLLATGIKDSKAVAESIKLFRTNGFSQAGIFKEASLKVKPRDGQLLK